MNPETAIQIQLVKYLKTLRVLYNASCGGMLTTKRQAGIHKAMGANKGFPDVFIYEPMGKLAGLALELKSAKKYPSEEQKEWRLALEKRGYKAVICPYLKTDWECFDWAVEQINEYLGVS